MQKTALPCQNLIRRINSQILFQYGNLSYELDWNDQLQRQKNKKRRSPKMDALKTLIAKTGYEKIRSAGHVKPQFASVRQIGGF